MPVSRWWRRVGLACHLTAVFALFVGLLALTPLIPQTSNATVGTDDYPARLRSAAQDSLADPWLFYNRECTSFVAWRLNNDAGVAFHNYYLGVHWGDASNWKAAAARVGVPVDSTAQRGAVAWWAAGSAGSSRGHVAWVSGTTRSSITVEEYNYLFRGGYDQRTISTGSSMWPSAFIHVGEVSLRNTSAPSINGTPKVGGKLTARAGAWSPSGATYSYQWLANGETVRGATHRSFAPRAAQVGQRLQVQVSASVAAGNPVVATSTRTRAVAPGDLVSTARPTIIGVPQVGVRLTAGPGSWTPSGASYTYQWLADGAPISQATRRTFVPKAAQLGTSIHVQVTASAEAMKPSSATSARTVDVAPGVLQATERPTITGTPQVDSQLSATSGGWAPKASYAYQWNTGRTPIAGAVASTFSPTARQLGRRLSVMVTATRDGYTTASSRSVVTDLVAPATFATTGPPTITGTAQVDRPLTVSPGAWSPAGTPSYRWFVAGVAVPGATGTTFTPGTDDLRKQVAVQVTMTRPGYTTATSSSAATNPVLRGTFQNSSDPTISGVPRVGVPLTADPGGWSPDPTLHYQWYADGAAIPGATAATFTPTGAELAKHLTVEVTARRLGYLTALTASTPTAKVAPGTITVLRRPDIAGTPVVGGTLTATPGTWTVKPTSATFQWYADGAELVGATTASYPLSTAVLDQRLTVRVTVSADGYLPTSKKSAATEQVVLGQAAFTSAPTVSGTLVLGHRLSADRGTSSPSSADASYTWLRSGVPIAGATAETYRLAAADVGQRITVEVTLTAQHWSPRTAQVGTGNRVRSVPILDVRSGVVGHRILLRFSVAAPGISQPQGSMVVTERGERVGTALVRNGRGRLALYHVTPGTHRYRLSYTGPLQTSRNARIDVTVA